MSSGLPDYFRGVDVAYQALSQMIVRPKYGGAQSVMGSAEVGASGDTVLASISGRGMIYGGVVYLDYTSTQGNSKPILAIDGVALTDIKFKDLNDFLIVVPGSFPATLLKHDSTNFVYSVGFSFGITFESLCEIIYTEEHGTTPTVFYNLAYALI